MIIVYQIFFIGVQIICGSLFAKKGLVVSYLFILLWTLSKTFHGLFVLQLVIQTVTFFILLNNFKSESGSEK